MERPPHVVLVGIDEYQNPDTCGPLEHAVKDTDIVYNFLINHLGCTPQHIYTLHNSRATRGAILSTLRIHLIANGNILFGDPMFIVFAGHGTRCLSLEDRKNWATEDGYYQAICPFDSGTIDDDGKEVEDIRDALLGEISLELAKVKGDNIWWVLDCCYSGSGTRHRRALRASERDRRVAPSMQVPNPFPLEQPARGAPITLRSSARSAVLGGAIISPSARVDDFRFPSLRTHIVFSSCRQDEQAGDGWFIRRLVAVMREHLPDILTYQLSYSELYAYVVEDCNKDPYVYHRQHPQLEGKNKDRAVFSTRMMDVRRELVPATVNSGDWGEGVLQLRIAVGDAHNVGLGAQFYLWPTRLRGKTEDPRFNRIGQAIVTQVNATDCLASAILVDPSQSLPTCMFAGMICTEPSCEFVEHHGFRITYSILPNAQLSSECIVHDPLRLTIEMQSLWTNLASDSFHHSNLDRPFSDIDIQLLRMNPTVPSVGDVENNPQLNLIEKTEGYRTANISNGDSNYVFRLFNPSNDDLYVTMQLYDPDRNTISEMYTSPSSWCPSAFPLSPSRPDIPSRKFSLASLNSAPPTLRRASALTLGDRTSGVEPFRLGLDEKGKRRESDIVVKITVATEELSIGMGMVMEQARLPVWRGDEPALYETMKDIMEMDRGRLGLRAEDMRRERERALEKYSSNIKRERRKWDSIYVTIRVPASSEV